MHGRYWHGPRRRRTSRRRFLGETVAAGLGAGALTAGCAQEGEVAPEEERVVPPEAPEITTSHIGIPKGTQWGGLHISQDFDDCHSLDPHTHNALASQRRRKPAHYPLGEHPGGAPYLRFGR